MYLGTSFFKTDIAKRLNEYMNSIKDESAINILKDAIYTIERKELELLEIYSKAEKLKNDNLRMSGVIRDLNKKISYLELEFEKLESEVVQNG